MFDTDRNPIGLRKAKGAKSGVPDMVICWPAGQTGWIELKAKKGCVQDSQREVHEALALIGHRVAVCRSTDEVLTTLLGWGVPCRGRSGMSEDALPLNAISIGDRVRRAQGNIAALARSMAELGMLHPVVITPDGRLVAGERRLLAARLLGWDTVPVRYIDIGSIVLGELAENVVRKDFTRSERVAIGRLVEAKLGERRGRPPKEKPENFPEIPEGKETRQLAAERAGFGNETTYRQAKTVVDQGAPELVHAMDAGDIAISAAARIAKLPAEEQPERARKLLVQKHTGQYEWYTPDESLDAARSVLGGFDLDPASSEIAQSRVQASRFFTKQTDGLAQKWTGRVWMNPPMPRARSASSSASCLSTSHRATSAARLCS